MKWKPEDYKKMMELFPMVCVDAAVYINGKFLLVKRKRQPVKGEWWVIGGRVYKNEKLDDAMVRKIKEEVGIDSLVRKLGVDETIFDKSSFDFGIHTVNIYYFAEPKSSDFRIILDKDHSEYKLIDKLEENLHPYVKKVLIDAFNYANSSSKTNSKV